jgi:MarR-like DNA-binding transcriptional regulator SgrR of sgrS sRNA
MAGDVRAIKTSDVTEALGLSDRMARVLIHGWVEDGWLVRTPRSGGGPTSYRQFIGNISAVYRQCLEAKNDKR